MRLRGYRELRGKGAGGPIHPGQERDHPGEGQDRRQATSCTGKSYMEYFSQFLMLNDSAESESGD